MKNLKNIIVLLMLSFIGFGFIYSVSADSGWDSSYDSGGSYGGYDSSWGSDYDYDYGSSWSDNDYGYSGGGSSGGSMSFEEAILYMVIMIIIFTSVIITSAKKAGMKTYTSRGPKVVSNIKEHLFNEMSDADIVNVDPSINPTLFREQAFNIYKDIQEAWMNFDTDTIRNLTTDELYNMYSTQLETLKLKGQKNIMEHIHLEKCKIISAKKENGIIEINVYMRVCCYDYVIKESTKEVLRGRNNLKIRIEYLITYVKSANNKEKKEKCPNCGALVNMNASSECPYCNSVLVKNASEYVMSKKSAIAQHFEG